MFLPYDILGNIGYTAITYNKDNSNSGNNNKSKNTHSLTLLKRNQEILVSKC